MRTLVLSVLVAGLPACWAAGGSGGGGATAKFAFANCSGDCGLDNHPLAAGGARTLIHVSGAGYTDVRSTNPAVATFAPSNADIAATSGTPGQTSLQLLDAGGGVVATATVTVVPTVELRVNHGWTGSAPLVLAGSTQVFHVTTVGADGNVTRGDGAVAFTIGGTLAPAVAPLSGDSIAFTGTPGDGSIRADCPDATVAQPITVVAAADLTGLDANVIPQPNDTAIVSIVPQSAGGGVYAGPCAWQTSDPSVTLASEVGPSLDLGPGTLSFFNLNRAGTYTATCTLAGKTAMVTLQR
jgi:hypothetical protein